ncbi:aminoglycoside phosphotransferase family protein [Clostridium sp. D2Q-11]|uniref:Aminoglycoside phosphotransferase family protein n=1 Tax=Anaeromonas frigoriresistens TaxID=2683708 RepID=A0A942UWH0_9FIRM|nr:aminoglycoside phosphotransferase family protein [Anaeromonas frigoriresistens]MBS4539355.1 aminoglycoside phosphotransferase family protein [Anaeromonas frigoriresistens]
MINIILKIKKFLTPTEDEMRKILLKIEELLKCKYEIEVKGILEIEDGQNLNYFIEGNEVNSDKNIKLFLKIISKDGYPNVEDLSKCYELLKSRGFKYYNIIHHDITSDIAPYGFIIQEWIDGDVRISNDDIDYEENDEILWLRDFAEVLKEVHRIRFDHFGDIRGIVKFDNLQEYYRNIDEVIRWSFGNVKDEGIILSDLVDKGILEKEFLEYALEGISKLAEKVSTKKSVLIYGDMFPSNIIYKEDEPRIIDWDECRANWWVYEIARTTYYIDDKYIAMKFIEYYDPEDHLDQIDIGIRIEHIKQHLRKLCILCMNQEKDIQLMEQVREMKKFIVNRLENTFLY